MHSTDLFSLFYLLPLFVLIGLVIRQHYRRLKRRQATAFNDRLTRYHDGINARHHIPNRSGGALLEALLVIAFCGVIAASVLVLFVCADEHDLNALMGL